MTSALTAALLHFVWQGAAVAFLLALACAKLCSPRARYIAACAALFAMPLLFAGTVLLCWPVEAVRSDRVLLGLPLVPSDLVFAMPQAPELAPVDFRPTLPGLWISGALLVLLYRAWGWIHVERLLRRGVCVASLEWRERLAALSQRLQLLRPVQLWESALASVPATAGVFRPVILMPVGLLAGMPTEQVEAILLHELAHIVRRDYLLNLLQVAVESLLFYHPAVWWVSHVIRRERELCCDDMVIAATGDAATYARALASLEQHRRQTHLEWSLAATGGPLMFRIRRMLDRPGARFPMAVPAALFLVVAGVAGYFAFPSKPDPEPASKETNAATQVPPATPNVASEEVSPAAAPRRPVQKASQSRPVTVAEIPVVSIDQGGRLFLQDRPVGVADLAAEIRRSYPGAKAVYLRADKDLRLEPYFEVLKALDGFDVKPVMQGGNRPLTAAERAVQEVILRRTLESPYDQWLNQEVIWIVTDAERAAFQRLENDDERQTFIEQFWLRRDPTPDSEVNELREEHYRRVAWSNDRFGTAKLPGWKSDRGMVYVKFGPPDEITRGTGAVPYERWRYRAIDGLGREMVVEFVDPKNDNTYRLTFDPADKDSLVPRPGLTLYDQMGQASFLLAPGDKVTPTVGFPENAFDRMQRFVEIRPRPRN